MFTGIIKATGRVMEIRVMRHGCCIIIEIDPSIVYDIPEGGSVSVDGVCLTRLSIRHPEPREGSRAVHGGHGILRSPRGSLRMTEHFLAFELMDSTLKLTTLGALSVGDRVNIEPAMRASDLVGGHFVSGHVDGVGRVKSVSARGRTRYVVCTVPAGLMRYIVPQGSIAVNGVSLTVVDTGDTWCSVALTSYTARHTNLGQLGAGDKVNIETDMFAKYIYKFIQLSSRGASRRRGISTPR